MGARDVPCGMLRLCLACLKDNNIPLVTANQYVTTADLSPQAVQAGALVGPNTLDGLLFYPQAERVQAGNALYQMFLNQALSKEYGLGTLPGINSDIAGPLAG